MVISTPTFHADHSLAQRVEAAEVKRGVSTAETLRNLGYAPEAQAKRIGSGVAVFASVGYPINQGVGLGMGGPVSEEELDQFEGFYHPHRVVPTLALCPLADPTLGDGLARRNYRIVRFFNVFARPLPPNDVDLVARSGTGIQVEPVERDDADRWVHTATSHADWRQRARREWLVALAAAAPHRTGVTCFLAHVNGEPAGIGALSMVDGVAGLFHGFTRPEYRGRGVQFALLRVRLAYAAAHGCDLATTTTSPPGNASQRNVERAGFRVVYTLPVLEKGVG